MIVATHTGIRTRPRSTAASATASPPERRSPTIPSGATRAVASRVTLQNIHSVGHRLNPRYIVGAARLDQ
jgi:hypothetical protein